jgi:hypothetical protein
LAARRAKSKIGGAAAPLDDACFPAPSGSRSNRRGALLIGVKPKIMGRADVAAPDVPLTPRCRRREVFPPPH